MISKFLRRLEIQKRCKGPTYKKIAGCLRYSFKLRIKYSENFASDLKPSLKALFCLKVIVWLNLTKAMQVKVTLIDIRRSI